MKSALYLVNHIVNKKNITVFEQKFIMTSMNLLLHEQVEFGKFFENNYENKQFAANEELKNRYSNLCDMAELPEFSEDKCVIRKLGNR